MNEFIQIKHSSAKKNWSEAAEKNFHKSLDHRSFYFKKQEKKLTAQNRFISEAEYRYNIVNGKTTNIESTDNNKEVYKIKRLVIKIFNLQIMEKNPEKYLETLNTFDGITLGYKCMHAEGVEPIKLQELYLFFFKETYFRKGKTFPKFQFSSSTSPTSVSWKTLSRFSVFMLTIII